MATHPVAPVPPVIVNFSSLPNIVGLELSKIGLTATALTSQCKDAGLWISALGPHYARLVTHLDFNDKQCDEAIEILTKILQSALVAK